MIKFGPSGNSQSFFDEGNKTSLQAPKWLKEKGLSAYEYSFGRGYTMSLETAKQLGEEAKINNIMVSVHAPYFINLANPDEVMKEKSFNYIIKGFEYLKAMRGEHLVVHIGSQGKLERSQAIKLIDERLTELLERLEKLNLKNMYLCIETMGKNMQIGTYKEVINFCQKNKMLLPTFDFGHINAITQGGLKTKEDYQKIFDLCFEKLGEFKTKNCHIHFSKIEYGAKGEIKHLNYSDKIFGPDFFPLAEVLCDKNLTPTIICESKVVMAEDALILKNIYEMTKNSRQNQTKRL